MSAAVLARAKKYRRGVNLLLLSVALPVIGFASVGVMSAAALARAKKGVWLLSGKMARVMWLTVQIE